MGVCACVCEGCAGRGVGGGELIVSEEVVKQTCIGRSSINEIYRRNPHVYYGAVVVGFFKQCVVDRFNTLVIMFVIEIT